MTKEDSSFNAGAIWAASTIYRMHHDTVVAKDFLHEISDLEEAAKSAAEYDVHPLRLFVLRELPLGNDADYDSISYGPVDRHGEVICDHAEASTHDTSRQTGYGVYAHREGQKPLTLIDDLDDEDEAEPLSLALSEQLQKIKAGNYVA